MSGRGPTASPSGGPLPARADVVVVGAGITGAVITHHLARRGVSVVVVERSTRSAAGATGRSGGMVRAYDPDPAVAELAQASLAVYRDPAGWVSGHAPLHAVGAVTVADPDQEPALAAAAAHINDAQAGSARVVTRCAEVAGIGLAGGIALVERTAGWVEPAGVTADWLLRARTDGAVVRTGVRVLGVRARGTRPAVLTDAGEIAAGTVIAALGPWAAAPPRGLWPATPVRSRSIQVVVVERRPPAPPHPTFVDLRTGLYAKPDGAHRTLIGMPHLVWDSPVDAAPDPAHGRATISALAAHLPWLATARSLRTVRAADAYGPAAPGELLVPTGVPHVWSVRAWNGGGVRTAPEAGRRIADACVADALPDVG